MFSPRTPHPHRYCLNLTRGDVDSDVYADVPPEAVEDL